MAGRAYHARLPEPLGQGFEVRFGSFLAAFKALDEQQASVKKPDSESFLHCLDALLASEGVRNGADSARCVSGAGTALLLAAQSIAKDTKTSVETLKVANSQVRGLGVKATIRTSPMWIGAVHPADAWFVAPPAAEVHRLLRDLLAFINDGRWPLTLRTCVGMQQLLEIHPFSDGNGRTARALLLGKLMQRWGLRRSHLSVVAGFWQARGMHLHAASHAAQQSGDWSAFLELSLGLDWS